MGDQPESDRNIGFEPMPCVEQIDDGDGDELAQEPEKVLADRDCVPQLVEHQPHFADKQDADARQVKENRRQQDLGAQPDPDGRGKGVVGKQEDEGKPDDEYDGL